jgi:hypothetical protein
MKAFKILGLLTTGAILFSACKKKFDLPAPVEIPAGPGITIAQIKSKVSVSSPSYKFKNDSNLYCVVTGDEVSGNFYKEIFVKDPSGALHIRLVNGGGLFVGDSIRINLKDVYVNISNDMIELDSVNTEKSIDKILSGLTPEPELVSIGTITANINTYQSKLVKIDNVEFSPNSQLPTFAYADTKAAGEQFISSCDGKSLLVRTSGFSNFAGTTLPSGNGSIIGIVTQYGSEIQLLIRNYNELSMSGPRCIESQTYAIGSPVASVNESFSTVTHNGILSLPGWLNINEVGTAKWKGDVTSSNGTARASAYNSGNASNTMWIITPPVVYTNTMTLSFKSGYGYWDNGHPNALMAYVSTNFNGTNFTTANWTPITSATYANGTGGFYTGTAGLYNSGTINLNTISILNGYSGNFFVAWKHYGNTTHNSNIYLDDVVIQ